jgi:hypothetical protein
MIACFVFGIQLVMPRTILALLEFWDNVFVHQGDMYFKRDSGIDLCVMHLVQVY